MSDGPLVCVTRQTGVLYNVASGVRSGPESRLLINMAIHCPELSRADRTRRAVRVYLPSDAHRKKDLYIRRNPSYRPYLARITRYPVYPLFPPSISKLVLCGNTQHQPPYADTGYWGFLLLSPS